MTPLLICALMLHATPVEEAATINGQGALLSQQKDFEGALKHFLRASELAPNDDKYLSNAASAYWWLGKKTDAARYFRLAAAAAANQEAYDRVAQHQHNLLMMYYVMPDWATEKRNAASQIASSPGIQEASQTFGQRYGAATSLLQQGKLDDALSPAKDAVEIAVKHFGQGHPSTLAARNQLGDIYRFNGDYAAAAHQYSDLVDQSAAVLGDTHPDTLVYRNNLATTLQAAGDMGQAQRLFEEVVGTANKVLGESNPIALTYASNLGLLYKDRGHARKAQPIFERTWKLKRDLLGPEHPDSLAALLNLADLLESRGKKSTAKKLYEDGLRSALPILGTEHPTVNKLVEAAIRVNGIDSENDEAMFRFQARVFGTQHRATLVAMTQYGESLKAQGSFERAEKVLGEVLELKKKALGEEDRETLISLNNLGDLYLVTGQYDRALPFFTKARTALRDLSGDDHPDTIASTGNLALLYEKMGRYPEALKLAQAAANASKKVLGERHPDTLTHLNDLALVSNSMGSHGRARELYERVLSERRKQLGAEHPQTLRSMHNLALFYKGVGEYDKSLTLLEKAYQGRSNVLGIEHRDTVLSMNGLAVLHYARGDYAQAQSFYEKVLAQRRKALGANHRDTMITQHDVGTLYLAQGLLGKAAPILADSLTRRRRVLGNKHPDTIAAINDVATIYRILDKREKAIKMFEEARKLGKEVFGEGNAALMPPINNLAVLYTNAGDHQRARTLYEEAYALAKHALGPTHPDTLVVMNNLALVYHEVGREDLAEPMYAESLRLKEDVLGVIHPETLGSLTNLAFHHQMHGRLKEARKHWRKSISRSQQFLDQVLWGADDPTRHAYVLRLDYIRDNILSFSTAQKESESAAFDALTFSLSQKGLLFRVGAQISSTLRAAKDPKLASQAKELQRLRSELAHRTLTGAASGSPEAFREHNVHLRKQIFRIQADLGQKIKQLARAARTVQPADLVRALKPGEQLVDFLVFERSDITTLEAKEPHVIAVVVDVRGKRKCRLVDLGPLAPIKDTIRAYLQLLGNRRAEERRVLAVGKKLYDRVWAPLRLRTDSKVYVVPDGELHLVPFAALVDETGQYLAQSRVIIPLTSGRDVVVPPPAGATEPPVLFTAPEFGPVPPKPRGAGSQRGVRVSDLRFQPLPGTKTEGQRIGEMLKNRGTPFELKTGKDATERALLEDVHKPRLLHVATHGFFLDSDPAVPQEGTRGLFLGTRPKGVPATAVASTPPPAAAVSNSKIEKFTPLENPLVRSGLAFSNANRGIKGERAKDGTDGILTAMEVLSLDLAGTELVVLSACETGIGKIQQGDGVQGLRRAFQESGAATVLSTLWSIDDAGTLAFMESFYKKFLGGTPAQAALRETQRTFIGHEKFSHPYYWAPFVMVGK